MTKNRFINFNEQNVIFNHNLITGMELKNA